MSMEELKRLTSMRMASSNNSMSHIHDSLSEPVLSRAVPMQHYSERQQSYQGQKSLHSVPVSSSLGAPAASLSVEDLKHMTSMRLAAGGTNAPRASVEHSVDKRMGNGYVPSILNRSFAPRQPVLNPHTQGRPNVAAQTPLARTMSHSHVGPAASPVVGSVEPSPRENSVLFRSTSNIMSPFGGGAKQLSFNSEQATFTECNSPDSSFYRPGNVPLGLDPALIERLNHQLVAAPAQQDDAVKLSRSSSDEDSVEALLAEATNLAAFNFCDSNENTAKESSMKEHPDNNSFIMDRSWSHGRGSYISEPPSPVARNPNMLDRFFGRSKFQ
jgi:hypothetical protein